MSGGRAHPHRHLYVDATTPVHQLVPEAKIVGLLAFVIAVAATPREFVPVFVIDAFVLVAVVGVAKVPPRRIAQRLAAVVPFVAFALLLPLLGDGERTTVVGLSLSVDGLWAMGNILAKALLGATAAIVLTATTPVPAILDGMTRLRLPGVVVGIVAFMFRYLDLIVDQFARMRRAMVARAHDPRWLWQVRPIASSAGTLFVRTYERGERVHGAMLARGYTGTMPHAARNSTPVREWTLALTPAVVATAAVLARAAA